MSIAVVLGWSTIYKPGCPLPPSYAKAHVISSLGLLFYFGRIHPPDALWESKHEPEGCVCEASVCVCSFIWLLWGAWRLLFLTFSRFIYINQLVSRSSLLPEEVLMVFGFPSQFLFSPSTVPWAFRLLRWCRLLFTVSLPLWGYASL